MNENEALKKLGKLSREERKALAGKAGRGSSLDLGIIFSFVLYLLFGALGGFYAARYLGDDSVLLLFLKFFACLAASMILQVIIHESGHLVCGLISGYKFGSFRIFSIAFIKSDEKIRLKRYSVPGTAGQCLMTPPEPFDEKLPVILYNLGGISANLIACAVALVIFLATKTHSYFTFFLLSLVGIGIILALANGIPMSIGGINNDAKNARELTRTPATKRFFWAQMEIVKYMGAGVRLKNMPDELFEMPSHQEMKGGLAATIGVFACNRTMDMQDFTSAQELGFELLGNADGLLPIHKNYLYCDMIFCELLGECREEKVKELMTKSVNKFMRATVNSMSTLRMRYACELLLYNDEKNAETIIQRFEKVAPKQPYSGDAEGERELIKAVQDRYIAKNNIT